MPRPKNETPAPARRQVAQVRATEVEEERIKRAAGIVGEPVSLFVRRAMWARIKAVERQGDVV